MQLAQRSNKNYMATKTKQWADGSRATIQYGGQGDGQIIITSDPNEHYEARSMQIIVGTTDGSGIQKAITINQAAKQRIDLSAAVVTAATQTYSGSAKTPTPTVTLNGSTVPSSGYDVSYSNNTNAGTATITVTGKGDYTGTAYGTFTINKASGYAGVSSRSLTYSRSAQSLVTTSGNTGTVHYRLGTSGSWSTSIPTSTNAGTYTIYYYVDASTNYNAVGSSSSPYSVSTTIAKRTPVLSTSPSARTGLSYTGSAQNLLSGGAMKHSSSNSTSVSGTFTYTKGTNAGTYSSLTWSFTPTDSINYNSTSGSISGSVTIAKASRTVSWSSKPTSFYAGSKKTLSATVSAGSGDGTLSYSSSNSNVASVSGTTVTGVSSGTATITASISEGTNYNAASATYSITINAVPSEFVNMGLPSGLLWATNNVGASSPYTYDCQFFSWGNIDGHTPTSESSFSPYTWGTSNSTEPYASSAGVALTGNIPLSQDAARQNLGGSARMPTKDNYKELFNNIKYINADGTEVSSSSKDKRVTVNGIMGMYIESKINGNRIFFPCCGDGSGSTYGAKGSACHYWSSTYYSVYGGYCLLATGSGTSPQETSMRYIGMPIRAVRT